MGQDTSVMPTVMISAANLIKKNDISQRNIVFFSFILFFLFNLSFAHLLLLIFKVLEVF